MSARGTDARVRQHGPDASPTRLVSLCASVRSPSQAPPPLESMTGRDTGVRSSVRSLLLALGRPQRHHAINDRTRRSNPIATSGQRRSPPFLFLSPQPIRPYFQVANHKV
jgi:hypothetical protein